MDKELATGSLDSLDSSTDNLEMASSTKPVDTYVPTNTNSAYLEFRDKDAQRDNSNQIEPKRNFLKKISNRSTIIISAVILTIVLLISGITALVVTKNQGNDGSSKLVPSQNLDIETDSISSQSEVFSGKEKALLVNGDIITRGSLTVTNGSYIGVLKSEGLSSSQEYLLPNASGTICLNTNNCGFATAEQLNLLQSQLGQIVIPSIPEIPASSLVNNQAGSVSIQGANNRISVSTNNGVVTISTPQDIGLLSSPTFANLVLSGNFNLGGILDLPLNCSINANGGALTTNASGQVICSDDDNTGGGSGTVSSPGGTAGYIPIFTAAQTIADSIISQALGVVSVGGDLSLSGDLTLGSLSNGFLSVNGSGLVSVNTIDLGTDTSGDYVLGVSAGNGLSIGGVAGEGWTPAVSLALQANKGLEVDGNGLSLVDCANGEILKYNGSNQWACAADIDTDTTGSFTLAGTSGTPETVNNGDTVTIAAGNNVTTTAGATDTVTIATVNNPDFTTSVTTPLLQSSGALSITPGGALTIGSTGQTALLQGTNVTITSNGAGNDIILTSADQIRFSGFDCSALANGGKLTTDASGNISCAADNGGAGSAITGSGTANRIALYTGAQVIADSWLLQNGSTLELDNTRNLSLLGGNFSITGTGLFSGLITANGGLTLGAAQSLTVNGDAFTDLTGTGLSISSGSLQTTLGTSIDLTSEVTGTLPVASGGTGLGSTPTNGQLLIGNGTGYTLATITQGAGITVTNGAGSITVTNAFGSSIDLGSETTGDYVANVTAGNGLSGSASGAGSTPTLALGQLTSDWDQTGAFDIVLNNAGSELRILESTGGTYYGTLDVGDLTANRTYTLPDATGTICLDTGNCAGSGGGVTTAGGTTNRLAKFSGAQAIADSTITDDGSTVTTSVDLVVQGGSAVVGTTLQDGSLTLYSSGQSALIQASLTGTDRTFTLPDGDGEFCIKELGNCSGGAGGNAPVGAQYLTLALDGTLTAERTLAFNGTNFSVTDGGANGSYSVNTIQDISTTSTPTFAGLTLNGNLSLGANTIQGTTAVIDLTNFDVASNGNVTAGTYNGQTISSSANFTGSLTAAGLITANAGVTLGAAQSLTVNGDAFTDLTGNGLQVSANILTLAVQSNKGLEVDGNGLSLIDCANGEILKYNGSNQWACGSDIDTDTGVTAVGAFSGSSIANGASISGNTITFGPADDTNPGMVSTGAQTFAGDKTFNDAITAAGLLTGQAGLAISGAAANINSSGTASTSIGNSTGLLALVSSAGNIFNINGVTVDDTEFNRLDGKDAALVDTNDAVNTAITGTGALSSGSITSGFGTISTANNITTSANISSTGTGTITSAGLLTASTDIQVNGNSLFGNAAGDNIDLIGSLATRRGADYTTAGSADDVGFGGASLIRMDTAGAAQVITGISGGRDGYILTLVNADAALSVTLNNNDSSSLAANRITTGTGSNLVIPAGGSISLVYDSSSSLWRTIGGDSGACSTCANQALSNLSGVNINTALNSTSADLILQTTTSGNIVLNGAGIIDLQDNINTAGTISNSSGNVVINDTIDLGSATTGLRVDTAGVIIDIDGNVIIDDQADIGSATTGIRVGTTGSILDIDGDLVLNDQVQIGGANGLLITTAGVITDIDGASVQVGENLSVTAGGIDVVGNSTIATTAGNTLSIGNGTGLLTVTSSAGNVFNINGITVDDTEFNRLDGKDAALVDINDAVNTAITGTGALAAGSITSGFGSIDTGADNITTSGTIQGGIVNATTTLQLGGVDINTAGTLGNVAYQNQANTFTGLLTANSDLTLQTGDIFTINGDALTDLTGSGLTNSGGALTVDNSVLDNSFFIQGGNSFGTTATLGTNDANGLNFITNGSSVLALGVGGNASLQGSLTTSADITVDGGSVSTNAITGNLFNGIATTINIGSAAGAGGVNLAGGSGSTGCTIDGTNGNLTCSGTISSGSNQAFIQGGNSFGTAATLGTNDSNVLNFETGGTNRFQVSSSASTLTGQGATTLDSTGNLTVNSDSGSILSLQGGSGGISLGTNGTANTIQIGNTTGAVTQTINIGNNSTASSTNNVNIGSSIAGTTAITGTTTVTGRTTGSATALTVNNSSSTGSVFVAQDNGTSVMTIADGGATTLQNSVNSSSAFQIQNASGDQMLNVDTSTTPNLLSNPSLEVNATGWAAKGSATITRDTTQSYVGNASLKIATTATNNDGATYPYSLTSDTTYTLSFYAKLDSGSAALSTMILGWSNDGSTDTNCLTNQTVLATGWTRYTCTFTTGTTSGSPYIFIKQAGATARTWYVDSVQLQTGTIGTNIVSNSGFEVDTSSWTGYAFGGISRTTSEFNSGIASLQIDSSGSDSGSEGTLYYMNNLIPNTQYTFRLYAKLGAGMPVTSFGLRYFTGSSEAACSGSTPTINSSGWTLWQCSFQSGAAPSSSSYVAFIQTTNLDQVITSYIDDVSVSANIYSPFTLGQMSLNGVIASPAVFQNASDSRTAFQIQNASGTSNLLIADTINSRIAIGQASASYTLDVGGDINTTSSYKIRGTDICTSSGCTVLSSSGIRNQSFTQTSANFNIQSAADGTITGALTARASQTADLLRAQNSSSVKLLSIGADGSITGNTASTATTATTSGTGTNTTTITLSGSAFADNDVILIDNVGQDYYTRIVSGGGTATLTVSPAVTFEAGRTVTKYNAQNIGATSTDYTTNTNRLFQGYFLGGVSVGTGTTTLSDGRLTSTGTMNINSSSVDIRNTADSTTALRVQNTAGTALLNADTTNMRISIGSIGTAVGQLYVSGSIGSGSAGSVTAGSGSYTGVVVKGNYAYMADYGSNTLQIAEISNSPSGMVAKGTVTGSGSILYGLAVEGRYAYSTDIYTGSILVFDVSDPSAPVEVVNKVVATDLSSSYFGSKQSIVVQGRYAYVASPSDGTLVVVDIANPTNPVVAGTLSYASTGSIAFAVHGDYLYAVDSGNNALDIFNISNPVAPVLITSFGLSGTIPTAFTISDNYVYIVNLGAPALFRIYDVSNPVSPSLAGSVSTGTSGASVSVSGRYAYIGTISNGLRTVNISNPASPSLIGSASGSIVDVDIKGRYAYAVNGNADLYAYDLGGAYIQQLEVGDVAAASLSVSGNANVGGNLSVQGGLSIQGSTQITGDLGVSGTGRFQALSNSASAFQIQNASGDQIINVDTSVLANNLIENPSFEGTDSVWLNGTRIPTESYIGNYSYIVSTLGSPTYASQEIPGLTSNTTYKLTFYIKDGSGDYDAFSSMMAGYNDGTSDIDCMSSQAVSGVGWTRFSCTFTTGSVSGSPYIYIGQSSSDDRTFYIDGVQLTAINEPTNLVTNPYFESGTTDWATYSTGSISQSSAQAYEGTYSLRINTGSSAEAGTTHTGYTSFTPSTQYTIKAYARLDSTSAPSQDRFALGHVTDSGQTPTSYVGCSTDTLSSTEWKLFTCTFTTASSLRGSPYITFTRVSGGSTASNIVYLDAVQMYEGPDVGDNNPQFSQAKISLNGVIDSPAVFKGDSNSTTAFIIQGANAGHSLFVADTVNNRIAIGKNTASYTLDVEGVINATQAVRTPVVTSANATALSIDSGTTGALNIGTGANAKTITIGNATGATSVAINCGTGACSFGANATAHTTTVGSVNGAATTTIQGGTGGVNLGTGGIANTIQIGNITGAVTQTTNIGTNSTASSTNNVNIGSSVAGTTAITGATTITGRTSGSATTLTVNNSSSTGSILVAQDNGTAVMTIANGGATTFQNQANSTAAFHIQSSSGDSLLRVDSTNYVINIDQSNLFVNGIAPPTGVTLSTNSSGGTLAADTYYYRVLAYNMGGQMSNAAAPTPTSVTTTGSSSRNTISWSAVTGAAGYYLLKSTDPVNNGWNFAADVGNVLTIDDTGSAPTFTGGTYDALTSFNYSSTVGVTDGGIVSFAQDGNSFIAKDVNDGTLRMYNSGGGIELNGTVFGFRDTTSWDYPFTIDGDGRTTFKPMTNDIYGFQALNTTGDSLLTVDSSNNALWVGNLTPDSTGVALVLDNKNTSGDPTGTDGAMYYNSDSKSFRCYSNGVWRGCMSGVVFANTSVPGGNTVSNTAAETNFASNYTIPANECQPGRVYKVTAQGVWSNGGGGSNQSRFRVKLGSTVIGDTGLNSTGSGFTDEAWRSEFNFICQTTGGSGTIEAQGYLTGWTSPTASGSWSLKNTGSTTIDTTSSQTLQASWQFDSASTGKTAVLRQFIVEASGP